MGVIFVEIMWRGQETGHSVIMWRGQETGHSVIMWRGQETGHSVIIGPAGLTSPGLKDKLPVKK